MAGGFKAKQEAYVPVQRIDKKANAPFALVKGTITRIENRSAFIDLPFGLGNQKVATSVLHRDAGLLIVKIGDFATEDSLLNPLARSVESFAHLLFPGDQLKSVDLRTWDELRAVISKYHKAYSHFVLIGHGSNSDLLFANSAKVGVGTLIDFLETEEVSSKTIVSLSCHTGEAAFAKPLSESTACSALVAPLGAVHGVSASHFAQTYLGYHFLEGKTAKVAFNKARGESPGAANFRYWKNGAFAGARAPAKAKRKTNKTTPSAPTRT